MRVYVYVCMSVYACVYMYLDYRSVKIFSRARGSGERLSMLKGAAHFWKDSRGRRARVAEAWRSLSVSSLTHLEREREREKDRDD